MRSRSAPGSSTPTWRPTSFFSLPRWGSPPIIALPIWAKVAIGIPLFMLAAVYVIAAFVGPNALFRIVLRCVPFLPLAIWTLWFDRERPLQGQPPTLRAAGRIALLLLVMTLVVALLGLGLNWLYDPSRIV